MKNPLLPTAVLLAALALSPGSHASAECDVECPDRYNGICVQVGGDCRCSCLEEKSDLSPAMRAALESEGVSATAIERADRRLQEGLEAGDSFSFELVDEEERQIVVAVSLPDGE